VAPLKDEDLRPFAGLAGLAAKLGNADKGGNGGAAWLCCAALPQKTLAPDQNTSMFRASFTLWIWLAFLKGKVLIYT